MSQGADGPVGGDRRGARSEIYEIPVSSPVAQRDLRHRRGRRRRRVGDVRDGGRLHGRDGGVGLRRLGHAATTTRPTAGYGGVLPVLLPALPDLRLRRLLQPVDRRLRPRRGGLRPVRRRRRGGALQPEDRHLLARRGGLGTLRRARRRRRPTTRAPAPTAQTRQGSNVYGSWGSTAVQRGDQWAQHVARDQQPHRQHDARHRRAAAAARPSRGAAPGADAAVVRTGSGDVYAGHDGNVYRKEGDSWQKYDNGGLGRRQPAAADHRAARCGRPQARDRAATGGATTSQLDRDARARSTGTQRTRDYGNYQAAAARRHVAGAARIVRAVAPRAAAAACAVAADVAASDPPEPERSALTVGGDGQRA